MKTTRPYETSGTRGLILILAAAVGVSIGVGFASPAFAQTFREGAVIVNPDGKVTYIGTGGSFSQASGINDSGQVVGTYHTTGGEFGTFRAFITGPNGMGMTDLGTLGGGSVGASGINDSGQVVGSAHTTGGSEHAFITAPGGTGMTDLGTLPGGSASYAFGINDSGQVVGHSFTPGENDYRAFITGPDGMGMRDLNSIADLPDGVYLASASGINNQGQVIAYILPTIPEPASYALMLAGLGLVGFMARGKKLPGNSQSALS